LLVLFVLVFSAAVTAAVGIFDHWQPGWYVGLRGAMDASKWRALNGSRSITDVIRGVSLADGVRKEAA
jgi:hypothetical protein